MLAITPLYAALIGLLFIALSVNVIRTRFKHRVSVGDGGEKALIKAMRAHANCAEYAPFTLLLIAMAELQSGPAWLIHLLGLLILGGRFIHAYGFGRTPQIVPLRQTGMYLTFTAILVSALSNILLAF
ncbi:MAPEG family protein [Lentibacter algarum]|uniref:MAPEG family protein n=1 Tax=Lentibacter algarum TaxID=576131 RepID=UPI001C08A763|nr:MAPEG family protein [Lentibacter algarum]MBU2983263.1 MAPEG family protein [Lentibacter algarum]